MLLLLHVIEAKEAHLRCTLLSIDALYHSLVNHSILTPLCSTPVTNSEIVSSSFFLLFIFLIVLVKPCLFHLLLHSLRSKTFHKVRDPDLLLIVVTMKAHRHRSIAHVLVHHGAFIFLAILTVGGPASLSKSPFSLSLLPLLPHPLQFPAGLFSLVIGFDQS